MCSVCAMLDGLLLAIGLEEVHEFPARRNDSREHWPREDERTNKHRSISFLAYMTRIDAVLLG